MGVVVVVVVVAAMVVMEGDDEGMNGQRQRQRQWRVNNEQMVKSYLYKSASAGGRLGGVTEEECGLQQVNHSGYRRDSHEDGVLERRVRF